VIRVQLKAQFADGTDGTIACVELAQVPRKGEVVVYKDNVYEVVAVIHSETMMYDVILQVAEYESDIKILN
jgi:hypothetical protein